MKRERKSQEIGGAEQRPRKLSENWRAADFQHPALSDAISELRAERDAKALVKSEPSP